MTDTAMWGTATKPATLTIARLKNAAADSLSLARMAREKAADLAGTTISVELVRLAELHDEAATRAAVIVRRLEGGR